MSAVETRLAATVAGLLADDGVGTWRTSGRYEPGETAIVVEAQPDKPDSLITISIYPLSDNDVTTDSRIGVQVRCRAAGTDPRPVLDMTSAVFDVLHGLQAVDLGGGARIIQMGRLSGVMLGQDTNRRWERADSYHATCHIPAQHRL